MISITEATAHVLSPDRLIDCQLVSQVLAKKDIRLEAGPYIAVRFGDEVMERADRFARRSHRRRLYAPGQRNRLGPRGRRHGRKRSSVGAPDRGFLLGSDHRNSPPRSGVS